MRHGWVRLFVRDLEGNPRIQYQVHKWASRFWAANAAAAVIVFIFAPALWARISVLYLVLVSLYANLATDSGAMAAANASTDERITAYAIAAESEADRLAEDDSQGARSATVQIRHTDPAAAGERMHRRTDDEENR